MTRILIVICAFIPYCLGFAVAFLTRAILGGWDAGMNLVDSAVEKQDQDTESND